MQSIPVDQSHTKAFEKSTGLDIKGGIGGLTNLGKLGFHVKKLAKKRFAQKLDKLLGSSCTKILQSIF